MEDIVMHVGKMNSEDVMVLVVKTQTVLQPRASEDVFAFVRENIFCSKKMFQTKTVEKKKTHFM